MRLRTLPVSVAGVLTAIALALMDGSYKACPAMLCLAVAVLAQIASNFANEYYDYRDGLDRPGREGPRRGVTEGDITPRAMLTATYLTLGVACAIGCSLIYWGGWWMLPAGIAIALGVVAYSAGPYPLSRHGMGEVAVIVFFGIAPVNLTYYLMAGHFGHEVLMASLAVGLMGADVLIINNYRDADADRTVGKHTLAVILGRPAVRTLYLANGLVAIALMQNLWHLLPAAALIVPGLYTVALAAIWLMMGCRRGHALTPLLGMTAVNMLVFSIGLIIIAITI